MKMRMVIAVFGILTSAPLASQELLGEQGLSVSNIVNTGVQLTQPLTALSDQALSGEYAVTDISSLTRIGGFDEVLSGGDLAASPVGLPMVAITQVTADPLSLLEWSPHALFRNGTYLGGVRNNLGLPNDLPIIDDEQLPIGGDAGAGLIPDELPLPMDALDAETATGLLSGMPLPGL